MNGTFEGLMRGAEGAALSVRNAGGFADGNTLEIARRIRPGSTINLLMHGGGAEGGECGGVVFMQSVFAGRQPETTKLGAVASDFAGFLVGKNIDPERMITVSSRPELVGLWWEYQRELVWGAVRRIRGVEINDHGGPVDVSSEHREGKKVVLATNDLTMRPGELAAHAVRHDRSVKDALHYSVSAPVSAAHALASMEVAALIGMQEVYTVAMVRGYELREKEPEFLKNMSIKAIRA